MLRWYRRRCAAECRLVAHIGNATSRWRRRILKLAATAWVSWSGTIYRISTGVQWVRSHVVHMCIRRVQQPVVAPLWICLAACSQAWEADAVPEINDARHRANCRATRPARFKHKRVKIVRRARFLSRFLLERPPSHWGLTPNVPPASCGKLNAICRPSRGWLIATVDVPATAATQGNSPSD